MDAKDLIEKIRAHHGYVRAISSDQEVIDELSLADVKLGELENIFITNEGCEDSEDRMG